MINVNSSNLIDNEVKANLKEIIENIIDKRDKSSDKMVKSEYRRLGKELEKIYYGNPGKRGKLK